MTCISADAQNYHRMAADAPDKHLLGWMEWPEFKKPMSAHNSAWRAFIGIMRREAFRRGIWAPE